MLFFGLALVAQGKNVLPDSLSSFRAIIVTAASIAELSRNFGVVPCRHKRPSLLFQFRITFGLRLMEDSVRRTRFYRFDTFTLDARTGKLIQPGKYIICVSSHSNFCWRFSNSRSRSAIYVGDRHESPSPVQLDILFSGWLESTLLFGLSKPARCWMGNTAYQACFPMQGG